MANEGFEVEEWDADFLDQLVQAEELALSSATQSCPPPPPLPPAPPPHSYTDISYSPPRELSQRVPDVTKVVAQSSDSIFTRGFSTNDNAKEQEIDRLKKELGRVSKQLTRLEHECVELKRERDEKKEQLRSVYSRFTAKGAEVHGAVIIGGARNFGILDDREDPPENPNANSLNERVCSGENASTSASKHIGVQTDKTSEDINLSLRNDSSTCSNKLFETWGLSSQKNLGRLLVSNLFVTCEADFRILFGCRNLNCADENKMDPSRHESDAKVSNLYSVLAKVNNEMLRLEDLLEALVDLCRLENVIILYRSLRILHAVLKFTFSMERKFGKRDNIICEDGCLETGCLLYSHAKETLDQGCTLHGVERSHERISCRVETSCYSFPISVSCYKYISLFELMYQITMRNHEEYVRTQTISIMNMILIRSNAYTERHNFGWNLVFQNVAKLLKREAGFNVRKQAVRLLYLFFNCPKVMATFCDSTKAGGETAAANDIMAKNTSAFEGFDLIFEGLAECVAWSENNAEELKLRRNAIILLAFLASSGKSGFEILLSPRIPKRMNFLALILQSLASDIDMEVLESASPEVFKERTLVMREALILLNRVVSHTQYSVPALRALTNGSATASLSVDVANRLSCKKKCLRQDDSMTRQIRESEIVDLAWVFKKRIFAFLGDSIS